MSLENRVIEMKELISKKNTFMNSSYEKINQLHSDVQNVIDRHKYPYKTRAIIGNENLLPTGLLIRLHNAYPNHSGIFEDSEFLFEGKNHYAGLRGFNDIVETLQKNGIEIGHIKDRECFVEVYRFLATKHVLNSINWQDFTNDSIFQLVFPQPGMIKSEMVKQYTEAKSEDDRKKIVVDYIKKTNPHDGKQKLNRPCFENQEGVIEIVEGGQHKYPQCHLIFDKTTQNCFSFCTYCFRHAQVRGDEDMFLQKEVKQIHEYLKLHKEVTDMLITGGDAGYMPYERLKEYMLPGINDPELSHIKTLRIGSRALTFHPELILTPEYNKILNLFKMLIDNGIQVVWMTHFSTPREVLNISTIAAIRRLRANGIVVKSQSPAMNHISLFTKENGTIDVDKSAQNWIDLGNIFSMLTVGFHSMYCARPTGEHHYFTVPLADINAVFNKVFRSLPSISRPSRYITMASSGGKTSLLGVTEVNGQKAFALKFNEGRNMEWMDKVYLAKYDEKENTIEKLKPFDSDKFFFEDELALLENSLEQTLAKRNNND